MPLNFAETYLCNLAADKVQGYFTLWADDIEYITRLFEEYCYTLLTEQEVAKTLDFEVNISVNLG